MRVSASGLLASVLATTIVLGTLPQTAPCADAQPATPVNITRAKEQYKRGEAAMAQGRYADAATDYEAAYELSKDPALFYKIGSANQKAGKCEAAITYYLRYLKEGKPVERFAALTKQKIQECGGDPDKPTPTTGIGTSGTTTVPPIKSTTTDKPTTPPEVKPAPPPTPKPENEGPIAQPIENETLAAKRKATKDVKPLTPKEGAWLMVGGSLAFLTIGAVLAYSADAAENDVNDLYLGLTGTPPRYDSRTQKRYEELLEEGEQYERLSIVSFAVSGALAIGAVLWFVKVGKAETANRAARVIPVVGPRNTGVVVRF